MDSNKTSALSFGFKSKKGSSVLKTKSALSDHVETKEEIDFIKAVDDTEIKSVKPVAKSTGPLVIPCIKKNNWKQKPSDNSESGKEITDKTSSVLTEEQNKDASHTETNSALGSDADAAAKALIEEAKRRDEEQQEGDAADPNFAIPLLMQNKIPDGFETDEKVNTELRPSESTLDDYEEVPIEQFGMALLRGMGWKDGEGIGRNKKHVKPVEPHLRPKGMGLGADKSAILQDRGVNAHKRRKPGDKREEEELQLKRGTHCMITKGPHADLYATIEALDEDNCRCVVKLSLSQELATVSQYALKLVDKDEFNKYSRYLNKGKSDKYKEKEAARNGRTSSPENKRHKTDSPSGKTSHSQSDSSNRNSSRSYSSKHKSSHDSHKTDQSSSSKNRSDQSRSGSSRWACPLLRVKIIDRKYKDGKYYTSKVVIDDVLPDSIVCKTDSGRLLEGLRESQLETVIPREDNSHVMIVRGDSKREIGQLLRRDRHREKVTVQLLNDRAVLLTLRYDDVCQYAGNVDHLLEF